MKIHRQAVFQNSLVTVEAGKMISPLSANPNQDEGLGVASGRQPWAYGMTLLGSWAEGRPGLTGR